MSTALILGATSDIGKSTAYQFASKGYDIFLAARKPEKLSSVISDINIRYQVQVESYQFDALDYNNHSIFYKNLKKQPDIVICVFGYLGDQPLAQKKFSEAEQIICSNYTGAVSILNIVAENFETRQSGTIIGISSVAGDRGRQSNYIYGSAKAAFSTYLSGLRNRLHHSSVHVITVKPGFVKTKMTEKLTLPPLLTATSEKVAKNIFKAFTKGTNSLYTLWMWKYIMLIIKMIPERIFKNLKL